MAAAASTSADPSDFAVSVAFGYGHVLDKVLGFVERTSSELSPVLAVSLALTALLAYLIAVALAFAVRVTADSCAHVVHANGSTGGSFDQLWQAVAKSSATVVKLFVYLVIFTGLAILALLHFSSVPCQLGQTALAK